LRRRFWTMTSSILVLRHGCSACSPSCSLRRRNKAGIQGPHAMSATDLLKIGTGDITYGCVGTCTYRPQGLWDGHLGDSSALLRHLHSADQPACLPPELATDVSIPLNKHVCHGVGEGRGRDAPDLDRYRAQQHHRPSRRLPEGLLPHFRTAARAWTGGVGRRLRAGEFVHGTSSGLSREPGRRYGRWRGGAYVLGVDSCHPRAGYSTVTLLARLRGWSTS
jgi:hypothetical protein